MIHPDPLPERPPGRLLLALVRRLVSRKTYETVFVQTYLDLREEWRKEWREAAARKGRFGPLRVRLRGYASFFTAAGAHLVFLADETLTGAESEEPATGRASGPNRSFAMVPAARNDPPSPISSPTANDRFKESFSKRLWGSLIVATALHLLAFSVFPALSATDVSVTTDALETLEIPPEVEIPAAPQRLERPQLPVPTVDVPDDVTMAPTVPGDEGFPDLPPPPDDRDAAPEAAPFPTPHTVRPDVKNRTEVARALERAYPPLLEDAGVGGTVVVWFYIDEEGTVRNTRIRRSSGHASLDEAALDVADVFEFTPALNRDRAVPVWIQVPITFTSRQEQRRPR